MLCLTHRSLERPPPACQNCPYSLDTLSLVSRVSLQTLKGAQVPRVFHLPWLPFPGEETLNSFPSCETQQHSHEAETTGSSVTTLGCLHWRVWGSHRTGCIALTMMLRSLQRPGKGRSREGRLREMLGRVASLGPLWHCCGVTEPAQTSDCWAHLPEDPAALQTVARSRCAQGSSRGH